MNAVEVIASAMPKWSNRTWLARRVIAALNLAEETRHLSGAGVELEYPKGWDYTTQRRWVTPWR